ncbi:MAG TPA: pyruvate:ferredoxin (flavodoxin) oxidoreductase, partial [Gemmatimonadales bacterium]|nr:pyruvate:ferredoxin (flavodoxin) oxidoreductase [Gemmatimonadales bacterium]
AGDPLYLDVVTSLAEEMASATPRFAAMPRVLAGRYGLGSKEFTPGMVKAVFDNMTAAAPRQHFVVGIDDDVTHTSLPFDAAFSAERPGTTRAVFYGLGADGTVGANKNSIKIIGEETPLHAQGYFVYDSKKSGSITVSHLRFGETPIRSAYLVSDAGFVACHRFSFLERMDVLGVAAPGATLLLAAPCPAGEVWDRLPAQVQRTIIAKRLRVFSIDAAAVATSAGLGGRINTVMQTCFFALSGVLPREEAIAAIKRSIEKTYARRGEVIVEKNFAAVDAALGSLCEVPVPAQVTSRLPMRPPVAPGAPEFVQLVTSRLIEGRGDDLPVSAFPADGTWPTGTAQWEKRSIAAEVPSWDQDICIQCGKCILVCPHAVIRATVVAPAALEGAPDGFKSAPARWRQFGEQRYTLQVATEDCTGCRLCVEVCPVKNKSETRLKAINMTPHEPILGTARAHWDFFRALPETPRASLSLDHVKDVQLLTPLFEFSGACAGCGETPYLKLMSQLFGDRTIIANATGCSSIYGGNLPTTPWTVNRDGRGPAWANSLFEDNAEFGLGMRVALDQRRRRAEALLHELAPVVGDRLVGELLGASQDTDARIAQQRERVAALRATLAGHDAPHARELDALADVLVRRSVWIVGGDGWAYDIGFGGLDHVLASGRNVNVLVLDTEVYSNTGGQMSKSTPRAAVAKFAAGGKQAPKKDLALLAMAYRHVYVAAVAMGGDDGHTVKVFREADAFEGPSLILAYSHCIAHGYDLVHGMAQQKLAVQSGHWPLFRYDPRRTEAGERPFQLDSKPPSVGLQKYAYNETRYTMLAHAHPEAARSLLVDAQDDVHARWRMYESLAGIPHKDEVPPPPETPHA